jgi:hypothetical protein
MKRFQAVKITPRKSRCWIVFDVIDVTAMKTFELRFALLGYGYLIQYRYAPDRMQGNPNRVNKHDDHQY